MQSYLKIAVLTYEFSGMQKDVGSIKMTGSFLIFSSELGTARRTGASFTTLKRTPYCPGQPRQHKCWKALFISPVWH